MGRILIVDDEEAIRNVIREYAEFDGYEAFEAADGMEAVRMCREEDFDVIVMDAMMPKLDGFSACKEIRKTKGIPVIMLSARGEEYDKLFGFEVGADDYVVKPFSPKELMARVNVVVSRRAKAGEAGAGAGAQGDGAGAQNGAVAPGAGEASQPAAGSAGSAGASNAANAMNGANAGKNLVFGGIVIDPPGRNVFIDGVKTDFTPKEYELLTYFVENRGIALSREKLLNAVWGYDYFGDDRTVDAQVKLLRQSLGPYRDYIVTVRSVGYKFEI